MATKGLTSVIVPAYHQTLLSVQITYACLTAITRYTDPAEYELILIEDTPKFQVKDPFSVYNFKHHIILPEYTNYATKMNLAARDYTTGEYLAFIQNDCFVPEDWLPNMRYYLEQGQADVVFPHQFAISYEHYQRIKKMSMEEGAREGARDACMLMMTREAFDLVGGFNQELQAFVEADFYERIGKTSIKQVATGKVQVNHIGLATHYQDMEAFNERMKNDTLMRNT